MKKPDWKIWINNKDECKLWIDKYIRLGVLRKSADDSRLYLNRP